MPKLVPKPVSKLMSKLMSKPLAVRLVPSFVSLLLLATLCLADATHDLHLAARSGDLGGVRELVESGVPVDATDDWGNTALQLAAKNNQVAVTKYLLEKGADPTARETFFGSSPLDMALWKGGPDYEIAKMLLAAGATDRASALSYSREIGDISLAKAAAESGPVLASEAEDLQSGLEELDPELAKILSSLTVVPDPPPPVYSVEDLADFAGYFESDGSTARLSVREGRLTLDLPDHAGVGLSATAERAFANPERGIEVHYFGRAGTVEGIAIEVADQEPLRMRVGDAPQDPKSIVAAVPDATPPATVEPRVNWPGFRGANRDGIGDATQAPPVDFDLESGVGVAWKVDLPGLGNSSPVVWGNRVYVTTAIAQG
ncbi:MAG: ankyrin repeat domain-containing protein, partial [Thermoanaerobaculia bacterium]|nr:ankyrin repeat domain-containing protein [Thermoanaerobaculia bacterium]